ncbi:hypothetical protein CEUSTIGMA_g9775.t1 [Chlamydomonas eustigma]|uniref:MsrB domain-containing protein n=1 Tax=Chlamydomonas eustigma TaxID=1157962 RepID=A0A250XH51_9CHLO|nr:hypothetical protein CEUSTIGMA_g9775.t1 [Chlamydomonas eustigma]|eukprot:GAX82346.1 hypothetical protein CEUSTIGMA_g9775.t1 [Chlamydomonas eustigma]
MLSSTCKALPRNRSTAFTSKISNSRRVAAMSTKLDRATPNEEWKRVLTPEEFRILRGKGTDPAGSGKYNKFYNEGTYKCAGCGTPLYKSDTKFDSGCGWPAFYDGIPGSVSRHEDVSYGMRRVEIT